MSNLAQLAYRLKDNSNTLHDSEEFFKFIVSNLKETHSQSFQDLWVAYESYRNDPQSCDTRFYVEFGAHDGQDGSNTLFLDNKYLWDGLLIEPNPHTYKKLNAHSLEHRLGGYEIENKAIYDVTGELMPFTATLDDHQFSTFSENLSQVPRELSQNIQHLFVHTATLYDILDIWDAPKIVDYVSMDTEGSEYRILKKFLEENKSTYKVGMWTIEHNYKPERESIYQLMIENGYIRKFEEYSRWDDFYILGAKA